MPADDDEEAPSTAERAQRLEQARQLLLDQPLSRRRNNMFEDEVSLAHAGPRMLANPLTHVCKSQLAEVKCLWDRYGLWPICGEDDIKAGSHET